jgi:site-specific DNA-methyltransferase (adenine-specific)
VPEPIVPVRLAWPGKTPQKPAPAADLALSRRGHADCTLIAGDNLAALGELRDRLAEQVALVYMDPPFFTGRRHSAVARSRDPRSGKILRSSSFAFDDRWDGLDDYLAALADRVAAARELLRPDGCLVLHVDPKTSHYAKVLCDEVFGPRCFASEIVWRYRRWPSKTRNFQRVHDVLLRYVRDPETTPRFRQLYEPLAQSTLATWGARKQRAVVDAEGRRVRSSTTEDPTPGAPLGDVWEIGIVAPVARERTGYPTQKPEALLKRLIEACTEPGDWVLDPYCGSGTTLSVCKQIGRRAVGIDSSPQALKISRKRLKDLGVRPREERVIVHERTETGSTRRRDVA